MRDWRLCCVCRKMHRELSCPKCGSGVYINEVLAESDAVYSMLKSIRMSHAQMRLLFALSKQRG